MVKIKFLKHKKIKILVLILIFIFYPVFVFGAKLYFKPAQAEYYQGQTFIVELRINTEKDCINAIEGNLVFSKDALSVIDFSQGNSILTLWTKTPEINQKEGLISFAGGIPAGFCGQIPGDLKESNLLGKIIFEVKEGSGRKAEVRFNNTSRVFLNDGLGTEADFNTSKAVFNILKSEKPPENEWQQQIQEDNIPPEAFQIEIQQEADVFDGKYFIVFSTTDKQTGIDYYEVKEGDRDWKRGQSPYLLENQTLSDIIKVRSWDKAGNKTIAEYNSSQVKKRDQVLLILISVGILISGIVIWIIRRKYNEKYK